MRYLLYPITGLLAVATLLLSTGCSLSDPGPSTAEPALALAHQQNYSLTVLSWDRVNVTGFKEYIILHSNKPIPDNPTPEVSQDVTILKRIDNLDITTLSVSPTLLSPQICYKLYCKVDERFLYSANLCIDSQIDVVDGFFDRGCHLAGNDEAVLFDRVNNQLASLNYKTATITKQVTDIVLSFPTLEMSTWDNLTNVFGIDQSPSWLRKYGLPSLTASNSKSFSDILWSANVHNQYIFIATQEFNKGFQVLSRNNLSAIDSRPGIMNNQYIAVFPGNPMTVLTLGASESKKYLIDNAGKVSGEEFISARVVQPDQQQSCADGSTLFIGGSNGAVINREGVVVANLNSDVNAFIQLTRLTTDESKAIYLINTNNEIRLEIVDLSNLPSITMLASYVVPIISFADIIPDGDIIYLIGTTFNSSLPQTFILKYPMPS
jgi:hypothetical protein